MTAGNLEQVCISRFPETGKKLFEAMKKVKNADFCVATSWGDHEIRIAKSCDYRGTIFSFTEDYSALILPNDTTALIDQLNYTLISSYLPKKYRKGEERNC